MENINDRYYFNARFEVGTAHRRKMESDARLARVEPAGGAHLSTFDLLGTVNSWLFPVIYCPPAAQQR